MKNKLVKILLFSMCLMMLFGTVMASAKVPYTTYTYGIYKDPAESPHAYVPETTINAQTLIDSLSNKGNEDALIKYGELELKLDGLSDVFVDDLNWVYLVNKNANQVLICDEKYNLKYIISEFVNDQGVNDSLDKPSGVFVTETEIYVADTEKSRIVIFDKVGNFVDIVQEPASEVFPEKSVYKPIAVSVDRAGRLYVVSQTTNYGVISLNRDGSFNGFLGPQKVVPDLWQIFWRMFQTEEQIAQTVAYVPTEYNNLTIDDGGFIYVTTNSIDATQQQNAMDARSKADTYAPVKKLNPSGSDVMRRFGYFPPSGEVVVSWGIAGDTGHASGASSIVDVALGPSGMWSIIDNKRSRIYTYDADGKLLFIFGDYGMQNGNIQKIKAIDYQDTNILAVDETANTLLVYKRTEYGDLLAAALQNTLDNQHEEAVNYYISILQKNNNFDSAYVGVAKSMMLKGEYHQAMQYYEFAYDQEGYSEAYKEVRKEWVEKFVWVIPIVIVAVCILLSKFFKYANKVNKQGQVRKAKRTIKEELLYAFHVIFHPFDGFWDLKHEKRGSVKGATIILAITILAFTYNAIGKGPLMQMLTNGVSYLGQIASILVPVLLWITANWCLTTLFDGEGSYKDIYVTTCYSLLPLPMLVIPATIMYNFVTLEEASLVALLINIAWVWTIFLIFFGMMVIHDYSLFKNIVTTIGTVLGMACIMFVSVLFTTLVIKIVSFVYQIYVELSYRV